MKRKITSSESIPSGKSYGEVTPKNVTYTVLKLLNEGMYANQIARTLGKSKVTIHRHIKKLIKNGLLQEEIRSFSKTYVIPDKGEKAIQEKKLPNELRGNSNTSTRNIELTNYVRIYIPILKRGRVPAKLWDNVNNDFKNSVIKHKDLSKLFTGASVRETSKGVEVSLNHRKIEGTKDVYVMVTNAVFWAMGFFSNYGYILDHKNFYVNDTHTSIWTERYEKEAKEHGRVKVYFDENRAKITPRDPDQQMYAQYDSTPKHNRESNSVTYAEDCLREPVRIRHIDENLELLADRMAVYAEHLNTHIPFMQATTRALERLEGKKFTKKAPGSLKDKYDKGTMVTW